MLQLNIVITNSYCCPFAQNTTQTLHCEQRSHYDNITTTERIRRRNNCKKANHHRELCNLFPVQPTEGSRGFLKGVTLAASHVLLGLLARSNTTFRLATSFRCSSTGVSIIMGRFLSDLCCNNAANPSCPIFPRPMCS